MLATYNKQLTGEKIIPGFEFEVNFYSTITETRRGLFYFHFCVMVIVKKETYIVVNIVLSDKTSRHITETSVLLVPSRFILFRDFRF